MAFSFGPNEPPRIGKFSPSVRLKNVKIAKPKIAPNKLALNVHPVFNPFTPKCQLYFGEREVFVQRIERVALTHQDINWKH